MDLIRNRYLLVPFLVVFLAFCLDKLLILENVHTYFSKSLSDINYIQKNELYEDLKDYLKEKNTRQGSCLFWKFKGIVI